MKFRLVLLALAAAAMGVFALGRQSPGPVTAALSAGDLFRLHIVANSDSDADQAMKLMVRDALLSEFADEFSAVDSAQAARQLVESQRHRVAEAAKNAGYDGPVSVEIGVFDFPDRVYGSEFVPAGSYPALRVVLGEGAGQNWWCVMYPPLCFSEKDGISITPDNVRFRSLFAELWQKLMAAKEVVK